MTQPDLLRNYDGGFPAPELWAHFKNLVEQELRRRQMWRQPPRYLGYPDYSTWSRGGDGSNRALEDLSVDAFEFAVIVRWRGLEKRIQQGENVEGHVRRNIRFFITECQKNYDPCGYAAYKNTEAAIRRLVEQERLVASPPLPQIGRTIPKDTRLTASSAGPDTPVPMAEELRRVLTNLDGWWSAMANVVRCSDVGQREMTGFIAQLSRYEILSFLFGDLVEVVKQEARAYWTWLEHEASPPTEEPSMDLSQMDAGLIAEIRMHIEHIGNEAIRDRVREVLDELEHCSNENPKRPSQAEIARRMGLPRQRISEAFGKLRQIASSVLRDG